MNRALISWLPIILVAIGLLVFSRMIGFVASLQFRLCGAAVFLVLLMAGLIYWKLRQRAQS